MTIAYVVVLNFSLKSSTQFRIVSSVVGELRKKYDKFNFSY